MLQVARCRLQNYVLPLTSILSPEGRGSKLFYKWRMTIAHLRSHIPYLDLLLISVFLLYIRRKINSLVRLNFF